MPNTPERRSQRDDLEERVLALLSDGQYDGHPLRGALEEVIERMHQHVTRLERITLISDRYQSTARERFRHLSSRYDRQINRLEKAIRISDRYQSSLKELNRALREASTHDQLTGLPNRKMMTELCRLADERVSREGETYALLAIDADRFKQINDSHGHELGDQVLIALSRSFVSGIREGDTCARWGGEEFLAILPGADLDTAQRVADRLLHSVRAIALHCGSTLITPRVSIGLAQHCPGEKYGEVFHRADKALLMAKRNGRDCYVVAKQPTEPGAITRLPL